MNSMTIEWFQKMTDTSGSPRVYSFGTYPATHAVSIENGTFYLWINELIIIDTNLNFLENEWRHFALVFSGSTASLYYDGVLIKEGSFVDDIDVSDIDLTIGADVIDGTFFNGLITNFKWSFSENYTGLTFSAPTSSLTLDANTILLLKPDNDSLLTTDFSNTGNTVSVNDISWTSSNPFDIWPFDEDVGSYFFNGTSSYLTISANNNFNYFPDVEPTTTTTTTTTSTTTILPTTTTTSTTTIEPTTSTTTLTTTTTSTTTSILSKSSYNKRVNQIYQKIDKIAKVGIENIQEYKQLIDELLLNGEYDIYTDVMFKYYNIDVNNFLDVETVKNETFDSVRFFTVSEELELLKKINDEKGVYQNGFNFYTEDNIFLGTIIESEDLGYLTLIVKAEWASTEIGEEGQSIYSKYEQAIDYLITNYTTTTTSTSTTTTTTTTSTSTTTTTTTSTTTLEPISANTIEWFQYTMGASDSTIFFLGEEGSPADYSAYMSSGELNVTINGSVRITQALTNYLNNWVHIALVNNSGDLSLYVDGDLKQSILVSENIITTEDILIGTDTNYYFNGKITNFRWTNDVVYSSNFSVPTSPLSSLSNSILLFKASSEEKLIFNSASNAFTINNNNLTWSQSSPFSPWVTEDGSIEFNGIDGYLRINNLGNFNIII